MRSSQCIFTQDCEPGLILDSLEPVNKFTLISNDSISAPLARSSHKGSFTLKEIIAKTDFAISIPKNSTHDSFLLKNEKLFLLLSPESFASFGLDAQKVQLGSPPVTKYLAVYNLTQAGKRLERLNWVLDNTCTEKHEFWLRMPAGTASDETIESSVHTIGVPSLEPPSADDFTDWSNSIIEWVGLCVLNPKLLAETPTVDKVFCAYDAYDDVKYGTVAVTHSEGFFNSFDVSEIWSNIKSEWAILHVQGFSSSPVAWSKNSAHTGELGYTLLKNGDKISCFKYI